MLVLLLGGVVLGCSERKLAAMRAFQGSKVVRAAIAFQILRDNPDLPVLDLRPADEFTGALGHLSRAINVPLETLPAFLAGSSLPRDRALLVYCNDAACGEAGRVALAEHGFRYVFRIENGIRAWVDAGFGTIGAEAAAPAP